MKKTIKSGVIIFMCIVLIMCTFTSCSELEQHTFLKKVQTVLIAIVNNDADMFCDSFEPENSRMEIFNTYRDTLNGVGYFGLQLIDFTSSEQGDATIGEGTLGLYTEIGNFIVTASYNSNTEKVISISIEADTDNQLPERDDLPWSEN